MSGIIAPRSGRVNPAGFFVTPAAGAIELLGRRSGENSALPGGHARCCDFDSSHAPIAVHSWLSRRNRVRRVRGPPRCASSARAAGVQDRQAGNLRQLHADARRRRGTLPRHHRLRGHRHPRDQPGPDRPARPAVPGREGPGQEPADAAACRGSSTRKSPTSTSPAARSTRTPTGRSRGWASSLLAELPEDEVPIAWWPRRAAVRRAAGPGHEVRRHHRRDRSGQAGRRHEHVGRGGPALRPDPADAPRHLRRQRAARAGRDWSRSACSTSSKSATCRSAAIRSASTSTC